MKTPFIRYSAKPDCGHIHHKVRTESCTDSFDTIHLKKSHPSRAVRNVKVTSHVFYTTVFFVFICLLFSACNQLNEVTGSFEELESSGRINVQGVDSKRFFRFHLRQFKHDIGGTFESFDMSGYESFRHVPVFMNVALNLYYCSRIDYGYVLNNNAYVVFTDKEQRQWMMTLELGKTIMPGTLVRIDKTKGQTTFDKEYLMPEDAEYYKTHNATNSSGQIVLGLMSEDSDELLECMYYYKKTEINFVLPDSIPLENCIPSRKQCRNYRLAIIGGWPQHSPNDLSVNTLTEIQSAYLDDCDLQSGTTRSFLLRDNPGIITGTSSGLFIATALLYEDTNMDGVWDHNTEPVLASLRNQLLVFYSEPPESSVYGKSREDETFEMPVLTTDNISSETGWHIYNDTSEPNEHWRILKSISFNRDNTLLLHSVSEESSHACLLSSTEQFPTTCSGFLPVLIQ